MLYIGFSRVVSMMLLFIIVTNTIIANSSSTITLPQRILVDTDVDTDDLFALLYLLKINRSEFALKAVTINANGWAHAGHAVNHIYDLLYMMGRDDIAVGVGGEDGVSQNGTIFPNVGGYLPIIEQGTTTNGYCRYRQAIPVGQLGQLVIDTNYGLRKAFLPQGTRRYSPLEQPTTQQVMFDVISEGPTTVFLMGTHTNLALFLMRNPQLKGNVQHIYAMGGSVRPGCCATNDTVPCNRLKCDPLGNLFTVYDSNPYAEYNIFGDPFAAYQVIHSGIPVTLIPLDATNTIPMTKEFYEAFEHQQNTYESQYCFKSLKMINDSTNGQFFKSYYMWDSFMAGVAVSIMSKPNNYEGDNEFAEMEYMNITVRTSNEPYGLLDGSNPLFYGGNSSKFDLKNDGVHSGHVQRSLRDPFCLVKNGTSGICKDGYTEETNGPDGVRVLVATKAKPNNNANSTLNKQFFQSFLDVLNRPQQSGRFNFTKQFPDYKDVLYKPDFGAKKLGKSVIFDMDMSAGDFLSLLYLLKVPVEVLNLQGIFITPTGWANAATIDVVYNMLHMMGRDDIVVGLGDAFATNQTSPIYPVVGDCKYVKAIPHGSGGLLDSDTLYGLARELPRSPRRYTSSPGHRQPLALEVWKNITDSLSPGAKVSILTNGPLTTISKLISSDKDASSRIQEILVVGGHISNGNNSGEGNLFTVPANKYGEFNMFLDPLAAKTVINSNVDITLIPLGVQRSVSSFVSILERLARKKMTPELDYAHRLVSKLNMLQKEHWTYQHMDMFLGEIIGALVLSDNQSSLKTTIQVKSILVVARGDEDVDGQTLVDDNNGSPVKILESVDEKSYHELFASRLSDEKQSAVMELVVPFRPGQSI